MKDLILLVCVLVALLDWLAVWRGWRKVGYFAKPFTIIFLFLWLAMRTRLQGIAFLFGVGLLFSLAGDIFLMLSPRFFMAGLTSFALVHVAYFAALITPLSRDGFPGIFLVLIGITGGATLVLSRIRKAQIERGFLKLVRPTLFYGILISIMLLAALLTLFRTDWDPWSAILISLGAVLFYSSDLTNAWIRFVNPVRSGRVTVMVTYHIGQILLIAGVVLNWSLFSTV